MLELVPDSFTCVEPYAFPDRNCATLASLSTMIAPTVQITDTTEDTNRLAATHTIDVHWSADNTTGS